MKLWYDSPGLTWKEALPVGNGRLGAMVFGALTKERIQINEETLWSGAPHDYNRPDAGRYLQEVRQLIFADRVEEAEQLFLQRMMGDPVNLQAYLPFCDLWLDFPEHRTVRHYRRELDLERAVATVSYEVGGCAYTREIFCSHPGGCLVIRLTASVPGSIDVKASLATVHPDHSVQTEGNDTIRLAGRTGTRKEAKHWIAAWEGPGLRFEGALSAVCEGGRCDATDGSLRIAKADAVTLVFSGATGFLNYGDIGGDPAGKNGQFLARIAGRPYEEVLNEHIEDYRSLFRRVSLRLGGETNDGQGGGSERQPTDRRIRSFRESEDPALAALYFQFGRYLLIASSRPGGQPANLQGIWNEEEWPEWGSKWTTNINVQMNYWPAEVGHLPECHGPLFDLIDDLRVTGARTAEIYYGARGFVVHHNVDLWRAAAPVDIHAGIWPLGGAWLVQHLWDHFEYHPDLAFLKERAYPAMKEAARFLLDFMVEAPEGITFAGRLVTNPSYSPENAYIDGQSRRRHLTYSSTMDLQLIRDLFERCVAACDLLQEDGAFRDELQTALDRLPPMQIGRYGQLQEWLEDWDRPDDHNGHVSHLYGLYPGNQISGEDTPELFAGARKSLELRDNGASVAWPAAWRIALHARLRDGRKAFGCLADLLAGSTNPNLFNQHEPFPMQIDANFGAAAGIAEMLLQSRVRYRGGRAEYRIELLPALPAQWPEGSVKGLCARGGFEIDMKWADGKLVGADVRSSRGLPCILRYRDESIRCDARAGDVFHYRPSK
ncbi:glycoside hydrolase family 95 protein [Cohnella caldifontis]|uniref:glycoside hydrolase family 95 protein n=1 Tax=Cohnella caldifontis TaxID=3027471 RepID=UPI0023EAC7BD|nr:glycoside hydrolase family 95 protein [Cohnella sp. YIM B05605]